MSRQYIPYLTKVSKANSSGVALKIIHRKRDIINQLSLHEELTINEMSEQLNISVPTATELTLDLQKEGLIKDTGKKTVGVGRKAAIYSLTSDAAFFLGVEVKKYTLNIGLMGFDKKMVKTVTDISFPYQDSTESLTAMVAEINQFLTNLEMPAEKIAGLGLSISGRINVKTGKILTIYHFADAPIKEMLEEALNIPVYIDNDSRTLAYGEYYFGQSITEKNTLIVNLDYGIALGIFVNGQPVYGASGYAGELGHIPIFTNEKICYCGKKGCLETEASGVALINFITEKMEQGSNSTLQMVLKQKGYLQLEDVTHAVLKGDNLAMEGVSLIGEKLGRGLAVAINLFNPELIVLGGTLSAVGEPLLLPVKTSIFQHSLSLVNSDTRVILSTIHDKAGLPGCCRLVRDKVLDLGVGR